MSDTPITPENFPHGVVCGCDCECSRPLNDGNAMGEDVTEDHSKPWEQSDADAPRVVLMLCAECYVGNHRGESRP